MDIIGSIPPVIVAGILFGAGVLLLLYGWHVYRIALVVTGMLVGAAVGMEIAHRAGVPAIILALPLGVLAGLVAGYMDKAGAFLVGGLCGAIPVLAAKGLFQNMYAFYVSAALAGIIAGVLAIYLWKPMIIASLAVVGTARIAGAVALAADAVSPGAARPWIGRHLLISTLAFLAVAGFGFYFQSRAEEREKEAKEEE